MNTAFDCFRKAAKKGDPRGQFALGLCYANGIGVDKDLEQARYWREKAGSTAESEECQSLQSVLLLKLRSA